MSDKKENLIVTFADKNYAFAAKQLFSGCHFKAGWQGDYLVLTPDMFEEDQQWFSNKGIQVKVVPPPVELKGLAGFPMTLYLVFYVFTEEFKKYQHIIYFDVDVLVRASFDELLKISGFAAGADILNQKLKDQFKIFNVRTHPYSPSSYLGITNQEYKKRYLELKKEYNLHKDMFNAGIFVLNTDIITDTIFSKLLKLADRFGKISSFPPQGEINLFFYDQWERLNIAYGVFPHFWMKFYRYKAEEIKGIFLHFAAAQKPWMVGNPFYQEWKESFDKADQIDLSRRVPPAKVWTDSDFKQLALSLKRRRSILFLVVNFDRFLGRVGRIIKWASPKGYKFLKKYFKSQDIY